MSLWDGSSGFDFGGNDYSPSTSDDTTDKWGSFGDLNDSIKTDYGSGSKYDDFDTGSFGWNSSDSGFDTNSLGGLSFDSPFSSFDSPSRFSSTFNPSGSGYALTADNYTPTSFTGIGGPSTQGIKSATMPTDAWGNKVTATPMDAKYKSLYDLSFNDLQDPYNNKVVQNRYLDNPLTKVFSGAQTLGKYGSVVNPAAAPVGVLGSLGDMAVRNYYGLPNDYSGMAASAVNQAVGGGLGGMVASNLTRAGVNDLQNTGNFSDSFGEGMGRGILGMALSGMGPIGKLANLTAGDWLKAGLGAYNAYNTNKMMKDYSREADTAGRLGDMTRDLYSNKANNPIYKNDLDQARREMIAAMSAQGKLGSGARVVAAGKLAENSADRNFQNYAQNYLQNMGNQMATTSQNNLNVLRGKFSQQQMLQKALMDMANSEGWLNG